MIGQNNLIINNLEVPPATYTFSASAASAGTFTGDFEILKSETGLFNGEDLKVSFTAETAITTAETFVIKDHLPDMKLVDWLTDEEKAVFKTSFEINQEVLVRLASARQKYICQAQSLNLFFPSDTPEAEISRVHKLAFKDKYIKSLYYLRSEAGVRGSSGECVACEG